MTIKECAADCGMCEKTIRRWVKEKGLGFEREGFRGTIIIELETWVTFCDMYNIKRGGK